MPDLDEARQRLEELQGKLETLVHERNLLADQMRFQPGQSGNPAGRQPGSRNRRTILLEALLDDSGEGLTRKLIELAQEGDVQALRLCVGLLMPARRGRLTNIELPVIDTSEDAVKAANAVFAAVSAGELTAQEGEALMRFIDAHPRRRCG
jgi:hypothetical protein